MLAVRFVNPISSPPTTAGLWLCFLGLAALGARGQSPVWRTTASATGTVEQAAPGGENPTPQPPPTGPGLAWSWSDGGQGWIATTVSLGLHGTQVFTETSKNAMSAALLSSFDVDPAAPIWTLPAPGTEARKVVSAEDADLHVVVHEIVLGLQRRAEVVARSSTSPTPRWTYAFATLITAGSDVAVSRDGSVVVAAISHDEVNQVDVAVLDAAQGTERSYTSIDVPGQLHGFDLSGDGTTLVFTAGTFAYVFDVATATVLLSTDVATPLDAVSISGDGSVIAFGGYNWLRVWERSGSTWAPTYTRYVPGSNYVSALDVCDDGSTIAYGFTYYDTFLTLRVEALDVPTKLVTMTEVAVGSGSLQDVVSDIAISADGQRFAAGTWGEASGAIAELRYYSRSQNAPLARVDLPGSVFDVAISADGQHVAAACKAFHANTLGNGGRIVLFDAGGEDIYLRGAPRLGTAPVFRVPGHPGRPAWLLVSEAAANPPTPFLGGTLYLDRDRLETLPMGAVLPSGYAELPFTIAPLPALAGVTLYFQGLTMFPQRLSHDWLQVTLLP
jgi:hypothetical protein